MYYNSAAVAVGRCSGSDADFHYSFVVPLLLGLEKEGGRKQTFDGFDAEAGVVKTAAVITAG